MADFKDNPKRTTALLPLYVLLEEEFPNNSTTIPLNLRCLLVAIVGRAFLDVFGVDKKESDSAKTFFFTHAPKVPFSFSWICTILNFNEEKIVAQILSDLDHPQRGKFKLKFVI